MRPASAAKMLQSERDSPRGSMHLCCSTITRWLHCVMPFTRMPLELAHSLMSQRS